MVGRRGDDMLATALLIESKRQDGEVMSYTFVWPSLKCVSREGKKRREVRTHWAN